MKLILALALIVAPALAQDTEPIEKFVIYTEAENEALKQAFRDAFAQIEKQQKQIDRLKNATGCT